MRDLGLGTGHQAERLLTALLCSRQVVALSLLTASGDVLECSESVNADIFQAARLHLGCLGVVLTVTFQCVPQFHLHEVAFPSTLTEVGLPGAEQSSWQEKWAEGSWARGEGCRERHRDETAQPGENGAVSLQHHPRFSASVVPA